MTPAESVRVSNDSGAHLPGRQNVRCHQQGNAKGLDKGDIRRRGRPGLSIWRELGDADGIATELNGLGWCAGNLGDVAGARTHLEQALALGRERQDRKITLRALCFLGDLEEGDCHDYVAARTLYQEALEIAHELEDEGSTIDVLYNIAWINFNDGKYEESKVGIENILSRQRARGNILGVGDALRALGDVARLQNDGPAAHAFYEESRAIYRAFNDKIGIGGTFNSQGQMAAQEGDYGRAVVLYEQWLAIHQERGDSASIAFALDHKGGFACEQKDYDAARSYYERCLNIRREIGNKRLVASVLLELGDMLERIGSEAEAQKIFMECLAINRDNDDHRGIGRVLARLGHAAMASGDLPAARAYFEEVLAMRQTLPDKWDIACSLTDLGNLEFKEGHSEAALDLYRQSLEIWRELSDKPHDKIAIAFTLAGLARAANGKGLADRAARLLGAANALTSNDLAWWPYYMREDYERDLSATRTLLGDDAFTGAWEVGQAMTLEQAVEYALGENE